MKAAVFACSCHHDSFGLAVVVDDGPAEHVLDERHPPRRHRLRRGDDRLDRKLLATLAQQCGQQCDARRPTLDRVGFERSHILHDRVKIAGNEVKTGDQQLLRAGNGFGQLTGFGCREIATPQYDSTRARPKAEPTPLLFQRAQFVNRRAWCPINSDRAARRSARVSGPHQTARIHAKVVDPFEQVVAGQQRQLRQILECADASWVDAGFPEVLTIERRTSCGHADQGTQPSLLTSPDLRGVGVLESFELTAHGDPQGVCIADPMNDVDLSYRWCHVPTAFLETAVATYRHVDTVIRRVRSVRQLSDPFRLVCKASAAVVANMVLTSGSDHHTSHGKGFVANLLWYARRLRSMSAREIGWRVRRTAAGRIGGLTSRRADPAPGYTERDWRDALARFRVAESRPVLLERDRARRIAALQPEMAAELVAAADRAVQLRFAYFGYPAIELPEPVDWNYDPVAGVRWPSSPATKIDYRTAAGDVKWIWELNRLQHLPWLAQAWLITGDERYSAAAFHQLDTWLDQNPPGVGIAWRNAFEAGVRAISIAVALQGLRDCPDLTLDRFRRVVEVLAESATRCWVDRSRFSSANNHLVGELAGLAVVAILFPDLPQRATGSTGRSQGWRPKRTGRSWPTDRVRSKRSAIRYSPSN